MLSRYLAKNQEQSKQVVEPRTIRTHFAGVEVELRLRGPDIDVLGCYEAFPSQRRDPAVIVDVTVVEGFEDGREPGASHPSFDTRQDAADVVSLSRVNAEGTVRFGTEGPIRAEFTCAPRPNTLEAIIRVVASIALPLHGALILHSSAVADQRGAQVFSGVSGAGKSTIARMLDENCAVQKISDELLLVYRNDSRWTVGVSPFLGSAGLRHGSEYPIIGINFLQQWPSHSRTELSRHEAMGELCQHVLTYTRGKQGFEGVLGLVAELVTSVPCYRLRFAKDPSVSEVLGITC